MSPLFDGGPYLLVREPKPRPDPLVRELRYDLREARRDADWVRDVARRANEKYENLRSRMVEDYLTISEALAEARRARGEMHALQQTLDLLRIRQADTDALLADREIQAIITKRARDA